METTNTMIAVPFHGDTVWATERDGAVLVAIRPICDALGVDWSAQWRRIERDAILREGVAMTTTPSPGGAQETLCLPLNLLPGWLFGIDDRRVKSEVRDKVLAYKRECYAALYNHFFGARDAAPSRRDEEKPARVVMPGHPDFSESVRLVREARLNRGRAAALAIWRMVGLPWTPELEPDAEAAAVAVDAPDSVARFAIEGVERAPGVVVPAHVLWAAYLEFCRRDGLEPVTHTMFGRRFSGMGFVKRKASRVFYLGIRPKQMAGDAVETV